MRWQAGQGVAMLTLADFEGQWLIRRRIADHLTGQEGQFSGKAHLIPAATGPWTWTETGTLAMPGMAPMQAERRYLWSAGGGRIVVAFADGRPFHDFSTADPAARHWCDPDDYHVRYDFGAWPLWRVEWRVRGPRKDYTMVSHLSRAEP